MRRGTRAWQRWMGALAGVALHASVTCAQEASETGEVKAAQAATTQGTTQSAADIEAARTLFWQAHQRFEAEDYAAALELFEKSYALSPQPELVFNIALTHEHLGHCEQALQAYDRYLTTSVAGADRERASEHQAALGKRCGPPPTPPERSLALNPASPAVPPLTEPASTPVPTVPAAALSDSGETRASESQLQTQLGWAALGAAAVSLGAVIYLDVQRRSQHSDYTQASDDYERGEAPADPAKEAESDFYRTRSLEVTMGVVSAVLAGAGSALLLYQPSADDDSTDRSSAGLPAAGFTWSGTF